MLWVWDMGVSQFLRIINGIRVPEWRSLVVNLLLRHTEDKHEFPVSFIGIFSIGWFYMVHPNEASESVNDMETVSFSFAMWIKRSNVIRVEAYSLFAPISWGILSFVFCLTIDAVSSLRWYALVNRRPLEKGFEILEQFIFFFTKWPKNCGLCATLKSVSVNDKGTQIFLPKVSVPWRFVWENYHQISVKEEFSKLNVVG